MSLRLSYLLRARPCRGAPSCAFFLSAPAALPFSPARLLSAVLAVCLTLTLSFSCAPLVRRRGWEHVVSVSDDLVTLVLHTVDAGGRSHRLTVRLAPDFPASLGSCSSQLPEAFDGFEQSDPSALRPGTSPAAAAAAAATAGAAAGAGAGAGGSGSASTGAAAAAAAPREHKRGRLHALLDRFAARVASYQGVFEALDELDACAWVLDPPLPASRSVLWRRVAVGQHVSLQLSVSPLAPRALCECHFLGPEGECAGLRERFLSRQREWSPLRTLRANLEALLGSALPAPPQRAGQLEPLERECGICYSYRLPSAAAEEEAEQVEEAYEADEAVLVAGGKRRRVEYVAAQEPEVPQGVVPDCYCDNAKCARGFHGSCLVEWLRGLPTTRHTLDTMFGSCPYCAEPISVRRTR